MKASRPRQSDAGAQSAPARDVLPAMQQKPAAPPTAATPAAAAPAKTIIKPFDSSGVFLFTPAPTYRTHYAAVVGRPDWPEYPPVGARIDYYLPSQPADLKLDILDAAGKVVRSYSSQTAPAAPQGRGGGRRGGNLPNTLPRKVGMNRFVWDLRYAGGPAGGGDGEGGGFTGGGPMVPPGTYKARLTSDGVTKTESITVKIDPRYAKDGITVADLAEQTRLALKVRDALAEGRALAARVRRELDGGSGDKTALQGLYGKLVTKTGPYEDQMWIDQMSNIGREIGQADQRVGASAFERFNELMKEWTALKADGDRILAR